MVFKKCALYIFCFSFLLSFPSLARADFISKKIAVLGFDADKDAEKKIAPMVISKFTEALFIDENFSVIRNAKRISKAKKDVGKYAFTKESSLKVAKILDVDYVVYGKVILRKSEIHIKTQTLSVADNTVVLEDSIFCVDTSLLLQVIKRYISGLKEQIFWSELTLDADYVGTKVYIEGKYVGVTPFKKKVKPSTYSIELKRDGFRTRKDVVTVLKGEDLVRKYKLSRLIFILSSPSGAKIYIDGRYWGDSPSSYYSVNSILSIVWKKPGYSDVEKTIDISSVKSNRKITAKMVKKDSMRLFRSGLAKEEEFSEMFKRFIDSKRKNDSSLFTSMLETQFSDVFKETADLYKSATFADSTNGHAYSHLAKIYYEYILLKLASPIYFKSELIELMDFATQSARIAINLETDSTTTLESVNILGSLLLQKAKNRETKTESLRDLKSAVEQFERGIKTFNSMAEEDNELASLTSLYDNLHFNLSLCTEEIYKLKKDNGSYDTKKWCKKAIRSWGSYDYLDIINPQNPFKPKLNPLKLSAKKHIAKLKQECSKE